MWKKYVCAADTTASGWGALGHWLGTRQIVKLEEGKDEYIDVKWPDGWTSNHKLNWKRETRHYSDHGKPHSYTVSVLTITYEMHGTSTEIRLEDLKDVCLFQRSNKKGDSREGEENATAD